MNDIERLVLSLEDMSRDLPGTVKIMEVCGTHTTSIAKSGLRQIIPGNIRLVSGPGCPVCVTVPSYIDRLVELAFDGKYHVLSFGDLFKVRGSKYNFIDAKALGANISMIYSPLDALKYASENKDIIFVIAAVGFETTIPVYAVLLEQITTQKIKNIQFLTSLKATMPALSHICSTQDIDGFICPGHVAVITGISPFTALADAYKKSFVVSGFEPEHILASIHHIIKCLLSSQYGAYNFYPGTVVDEGNLTAFSLMSKYFELTDTGSYWRGIGKIPLSSYCLKQEYIHFDAGSFYLKDTPENPACRCGDVMLGRIVPDECPLFSSVCRPDNAVGACMVSGEGACGIWYQNQNLR